VRKTLPRIEIVNERLNVESLKNISSQNVYYFEYKLKHFLYLIHSTRCFELTDLSLFVLKQILPAKQPTVRLKTGVFAEQDILREYAKLKRLDAQIQADLIKDEKDLSRYKEFRERSDHLPQFMEWQRNTKKENYVYLTRSCNLACSYCWNNTGRLNEAAPPEPTIEIIEKTVDFILNNAGEQEETRVIFYGGEPLLNIPKLKHFVEYARKKSRKKSFRFHYLVDTNGTIWNREIEALAQQYEIYFMVSIDGDSKTHDPHRHFRDGTPSHDLIRENIGRMLRTSPGKVGARAVLGKSHYSLSDTYDYLRKFGFAELQVFYNLFSSLDDDGHDPLQEFDTIHDFKRELSNEIDAVLEKIGRGMIPQIDILLLEEMKSRLEEKKKSVKCFIGASQLVFQTEGKIYPCVYLYDNKHCIGDVFTGITRWDILQDFCTRSVYSQKKCMTCWARLSCGGCCMGQSLACLGTRDRPIPLQCERTKEEIRAVLYMISEISKKDIKIFDKLLQALNRPISPRAHG